jgi:exodeoxyribonuclease V alpha subunit
MTSPAGKLAVLDGDPQRLIEVAGLGPRRTERITRAWAEQKAIKEVMIFLRGVGVSTSLAVKIYKKYGDESIGTVSQDPYRLASDVWGIGFKTADAIAASAGIPRDSPQRIKAGLAYTLSEATDDGHRFLPGPALTAQAAKILEVRAELIAPCLGELAADSGVVREEVPAPAGTALAEAVAPLTAVYLPPFYHSERSLAAAPRRLLSPGALAAPTGRAAKRLAELTGHDAATIHRLLQPRPRRRDPHQRLGPPPHRPGHRIAS